MFIATSASALVLVLATPAFSQEPTDYSALDNLSRFVGSTNATVQEIGKLGGTLRDMRANDFAGMGTGSQRRGMARAVNAATEPWKRTGNAVKNSAPYKAAPGLFLASDVITSVVAPLSAYDVKGATAGAVNIAVSNIAGNAGTAAAGGFGAGIGMAVGSFFPVIGTAAGGVVGGAIGSVAGGFISSSAYDIYVKQTVLDAVEGGLAWIFDSDPLAQAMQAREEHLRQVAAIDLLPEWEKLHMIGSDFGASGVELVSPPAIFYEPGKPEATALPAPETGDMLAGVSKLQIGDSVWTIEGGVARSRIHYDLEPSTLTFAWEGRVLPNRIEGAYDYDFISKNRECGNRLKEHAPMVVTFTADTATFSVAAHDSVVVEHFGDCPLTVWSTPVDAYSQSLPWKVLE
ncbi:MAG: hypothetical protein H6891_07690 [Brucellaceae bacterium]|nr:hypothetical protein [Brucellaceae bacterium]